ncbi:hypothetical protein GUITHDRAFT_152590 [Guillardia theta CCMP2712]|uniref:Uncharacterized protein n=2 Tax=Guillardia theta TaxID=55529 RepID=L1JBG8_GUITC|nr:hypothetical protein GUITHDRAFT_152590 [Guillardia theta CCMP2712]EKX45878.1 hypothetical protein GUITHDRAFT_152590 [Guillardia theta CCMP2712]|eukprot:XP_005832858.1 hypothetical protein GUITHDRAFT_152590 [Guillardia theta CCMP2712]
MLHMGAGRNISVSSFSNPHNDIQGAVGRFRPPGQRMGVGLVLRRDGKGAGRQANPDLHVSGGGWKTDAARMRN